MSTVNRVFAASLFALCSLSPAFSEAASKQSSPKPNSVTSIPDSKNQIVRLTDGGVVPQTLHMKREDSIAFFLNDTKDSLATIEIDFKDRHTHCSSGNLSIRDGGKISSIRPFGPSDFSTTCFHDTGTYDYTVYGIKPNPKGVSGSIIVE